MHLPRMSDRDMQRHMLLVVIAGSIAMMVGGHTCMIGVMIMLGAAWVFECIRDETVSPN